MGIDLSRRGFAIENEWFWRITETENAQTFDVTAAVRDFLAPLARLGKDMFAIREITADLGEVRFLFGAGDDADVIAIKVATGAHDRVALNQFVGDLNRTLATTHHAFALVAPKRYELRGVLLTDDELGALHGKSELLIPSGRQSSRAIPVH